MTGPCSCHDDMESAIAGHRSVVEAVLRARKLFPGSSGYDDAYSDGLEALWRALDDYDPARMELSEFLNMRVRSRVVDRLRVRTGHEGIGLTRPVKTPVALPPEWDMPHHEAGVAELVIDRMDAKSVVDHLLAQAAQLDPLLPEILRLLHEGHSRTQIAKRLGTSRPAIYRRLKLLDDCA